MADLVVRPDWAQQIERLRARLTEDTHIARWGNVFYRCCRPGAPVTVQLSSTDGGAVLPLLLRPTDLYITQVGIATDMGRYGSLTGGAVVDAHRLNHAVHSLVGGRVHGEEAFGMRSLVVFCVAEALRFDSLAHDIGFAMHTSGVAGGTRPLALSRWWPVVHAWGQACDAIWATLEPELRRASLLPAGARQGEDRLRFGRARYDRLAGNLLEAARTTAVLKRPAN